MSAQQIAWFASLVAAAEELGYYVAAVSASEIELVPVRGGDRDTVVIRSIFLSGDHLRQVLASRRPRVRIENSQTTEEALGFGSGPRSGA